MHILLVADGRSPTTRRWLASLLEGGLEVSLISTFPCQQPDGLRSFDVMPVAFGALGGTQATPVPGGGWLREQVKRFRPAFLGLRHLAGPLSVLRAAGAFRARAAELAPDIIHALRIPFEGMLASYAPPKARLVVSIWGNDLTLHAQGSPMMRSMSQRCLRRADGLMADASRDLRLGRLWGLRPECPTLAVPGSGGLDLKVLHKTGDAFDMGLPAGVPLVINPRGLRPGSVYHETFFEAASFVLRSMPEVLFLCPAMAGQPEALTWAERFGLKRHVRLMPTLPQTQLWDLFHNAQVFVSPSAHDGTPNTFLEAIACGCFPICGDIESLREWVVPGVNGLLVPPTSPDVLAGAIQQALEQPALRSRAAAYNARLIAERAEVSAVRQQVLAFYEALAG